MINDSAVQPVGVFTQMCQDIQTALYTISGVTNRGTNSFGQSLGDVFIGHWEFYACQEFYKELAHRKFEFFIGSPKGQARLAPPNAEYGEYALVMEMLYTLQADTPFTLIPVMQMVASVNDAIASTLTTWQKGGNRQPLSLEWDEPVYKFHEKPIVITTKWGFHGAYVIGQAVNPCLVPAVAGN